MTRLDFEPFSFYCLLLSGPFVAGLANKYGCRPLTIAGAIIAAVSIAVSSLSPNVDVLLVTYGIMGGPSSINYSLSYTRQCHACRVVEKIFATSTVFRVWLICARVVRNVYTVHH